MPKKEKGKALAVARRELKKHKREKLIKSFFVTATIISFSILLVFIAAKLVITGYSYYLEAQGGYITEVNMTRSFQTEYWYGIYGLALRVPGFTELLMIDAETGTIQRKDVFFDCIESGVTGGNEVYISNSQTINWAGLQPARLVDLDAYVGCSGYIDCPSNTFIRNTSIMLGTVNISNIPSTFSYRWDGQNEIFDIAALNDSENLVFVTHISNLQKGYVYNVTVNYQLLVPIPPNTTEEQYFFTDPYDDCPAGGGIGENIEASVYGWTYNETGAVLPNTEVSVAGYIATSNSNGFYNISFTVIPGTYDVIARKTGYDPALDLVVVNFTVYSFERNFTLYRLTPHLNYTITPWIYGYVFDESGVPIQDANVSLGGESVNSSTNGYYSLYPIINPFPHPIISIKEGYNNYYAILNFTNTTAVVNHNITMISAQEDYYPYQTGPYTTGPYTTGPYTQAPSPRVIQQLVKQGEDYWVSTKELRKEVRQNTFIEEYIGIYNFRSGGMNLLFSVSEEIADFVKLEKSSLTLGSNSLGNMLVTIYGTRPLGTYNGTIFISGDVKKEIPVIIKVVERRFPIETLLTEIDLFKKVVSPGERLKYKLNLQNLLREQGYKVQMEISIRDLNNSILYSERKEEVEILNSLTILDKIKIPKNISDGQYVFNVDSKYLYFFSSASAPFTVARPIYLYSVFGIPLWVIFMIIAFISFSFLNFFVYRFYRDRKKRYKIFLDLDTLPKPGDRVVRLGKIAEKNIPAYYEIERLSTHAIVAGATGMGKSIAAQVLIEEALLQNVAVVVFDPTAQWSGMLRKCEDKRMLSFYPRFGMKESDAKGFKGNIRDVKNAREVIDINKYISPGHIQILSLNKLDPKDMDLFVANVIRQIFRSNPQESPTLKLLIVFDEVHRLLAKFGGSGQGFLQVERCCREFRKWGMGVVLISQVLSDFVGEIKANINTEMQMRTIEESDLERIRTKYGDEYLKSLVRAETGVGMFQNAEYNRGRPYFINFRPILHNTRRLSDEELDKYNQYNDLVEDIEYQIEQLEKEKIDVFDLKMEIKLVKDKIMTGNFPVVDIYLEGLKPRLEKEWEKLGKKPKKKELQLVAEEDIKKSVEEAKKEREKIEKQEKVDAEKKKVEEVKEENIEEKQVVPLTFDNGIMVSSLKELRGVLTSFDDEIFKIHVNDKKNDISAWIEKNISPELGVKIKVIMDKNLMDKEIEGFLKEIKKVKREEKKEADKKKEAEKKKEEDKKNEEK